MGDPLRRQIEVQDLLARHGQPVPAPATYEEDVSWLGEPFVTMPWVDGHVAGEVPVLDEWITSSSPDDQGRLHLAFADALADVHALDLLDEVPSSVPGGDDDLGGDVERWSSYLDWATDGQPPRRLADALAWCREERPATAPPRCLLWGDARLGNAIFAEDRHVLALIDWETAAVGPAELDVGYWLGLERVLDDSMGSRVGGFPARADAIGRFEARLGRALLDLRWFEVLGLLSAAFISVRLDVIRRGRVPSDDKLGAHPVVTRVEALMDGSEVGAAGADR
jgi:aminoglycoside phosphotransferase (APT) family kinase protein